MTRSKVKVENLAGSWSVLDTVCLAVVFALFVGLLLVVDWTKTIF